MGHAARDAFPAPFVAPYTAQSEPLDATIKGILMVRPHRSIALAVARDINTKLAILIASYRRINAISI